MCVAVGGDGTVNEVARGLVNSETALGVIPTGSGNGYARNMGLPLRLEPALSIIKDPHFHTIDIGRVNEHIFLVSCGIGWEAVIATIFEGYRIRGILPYAQITLSTFLQYEPQEISISSDPGNWQYTGRPMLFSVTNMEEYGVGFSIAPDAKIDDGMLDICLLPRHSLLSAVKYSHDMFRSKTADIPGYIHQTASHVRIKRRFEANIHVDGTPKPAGEEIDIEVIPAALKVVIKPDDQN